MNKKRIIIGITGASGISLSIYLLRLLREYKTYETHLIFSNAAQKTLLLETNYKVEDIYQLADYIHDIDDISAGPASGSYKTEGMIIIPCSMKTVAGIYSGYSDNLLLRAADSTIKENRKLVICPREIPLSQIHLRNLYGLSQAGVFIVPPMMTFYIPSHSVEDMIHHFICKVLGYFDIEPAGYQRWK